MQLRLVLMLGLRAAALVGAGGRPQANVQAGMHQRDHGIEDSSPATALFIKRVLTLGPGQRAEVYDVGANNGRFGASLLQLLAAVAPRTRVRLTLLEPQPRFFARLSNLAATWNAKRAAQTVRFINAIADRRDGNTTLYLSKNSHATSTSVKLASRYGLREDRKTHQSSVRVRTVSLSRMLLQNSSTEGAGAGRPLVLLKLDIEGAETQLLQGLLVTGALCTVSVLRVEWHLNYLPKEKRLASVSLRHSLRSTLRNGCEAGALVVEDEEFRPLNFGSPVPGLLEESLRHMGNGTFTGRLHEKLGIQYVLSVRKERYVVLRQPVTVFRTGSDNATTDQYKTG